MPLSNMFKARPVEDSVGLRRLVRFAAHIEEQTMCKARFVNARRNCFNGKAALVSPIPGHGPKLPRHGRSRSVRGSIGGGCGAGVVGQNAKTSADREVLLREGGILRKGENAVFLIGARQDDRAVGEGLPVNAAH